VDASEPRFELVRSELVKQMLEHADEMEDSSSPLLCVTGSIIRREAHFAEGRTLAMIQDGLPEDTARIVAQDDMGFQLAQAASVAWTTGRGH
jgi:hypothetical protein